MAKELVSIRLTGVSEKLATGAAELLPALGLRLEADGNTEVIAERDERISVKRSDRGICITYPTDVGFYRALSFLPSVLKGGEDVIGSDEKNSDMLCYMADMSRDAVYNLKSAKRMIRYLALMGFNSLMLYTEDTYTIPEYPYFGHMRGRFSKEELKEIDDYAFMFGIEVIPCVQTLAHLSTALRWPDFRGYKDTDDILLVGNEKTYAFVEAVLKTMRECFRSNKINLGMDEAHMLGRGNYLAQNGYTPAHELMLEHLDRVVKLCVKYGYEPMIWSDMFFRMAFNGRYRVSEGEISSEIIAKVPKELTLIYWDYYSLEPQIFTHMLECHKKFNNSVAFAGGAWKWSGFAPHNRFSLMSTEMQLDICKKMKIDNMIVTAWGDNGGEASQFAPLPVLLYFAENGYGESLSKDWLEKRSEACFGIGYTELLELDAPNELDGISVESGKLCNPARYLLYNDPLEGLMDLHLDPASAPSCFAANAERLKKYSSHPDFGYMYDTLSALCDLLSMKCDLSIRTRPAYLDGNKEKLSSISAEIPVIIEKLNAFIEKYRHQWYLENKTFGFSNQEIRLGGLRERLYSLKARLDGYLSGEYQRIEELEQPVLSVTGRKEPEYINYQSWLLTATVGVM